MIHLHDEILCNRKKERVLLFATAWMEVESIMLRKISQAVKEKYHNISRTSGRTLCITTQSLNIESVR